MTRESCPNCPGWVYTMGSEHNFEGVWYPRNSLIKMEYVGSEKIWSGARQTWQILLPGLHGRPSFNPLNPLPGAPPPPPNGSMHQQEMGSPVGGFPSISPNAAQHMGPTSTSSSFSPNHYPLIPTSIIPCSSWPPEASSTPLGTHRPAWMSVDNPPEESENGRIYHVCMVRVVRGREGAEEDPEERETSPRYEEDPLPIMDHPREESTTGEDEVGGEVTTYPGEDEEEPPEEDQWQPPGIAHPLYAAQYFEPEDHGEGMVGQDAAEAGFGLVYQIPPPRGGYFEHAPYQNTSPQRAAPMEDGYRRYPAVEGPPPPYSPGWYEHVEPQGGGTPTTHYPYLPPSQYPSEWQMAGFQDAMTPQPQPTLRFAQTHEGEGGAGGRNRRLRRQCSLKRTPPPKCKSLPEN